MLLRDEPFSGRMRAAVMEGPGGRLHLSGIAMQLLVDTFQCFLNGLQNTAMERSGQ